MPAEPQRSAADSFPPFARDDEIRGGAVNLPVTTLLARFAARSGLTVEQAELRLFREALYPEARWLAPLLRLRRGHFDPDWRFVRAAGRATTMDEFQVEVRHYSDDKAHRGWLRGRLKLRVSVRRLRRLARELLPAAATSRGEARTPGAPASVFPSAAAMAAESPVPRFRVLGSGWDGVERRRAPSIPLPRPSRPQPTEEAVRRLEQEVAQLKEQREILKKAVGIMAQSSQPPPDRPAQ
jgi:hypothetical protein